MVTFVIFYLERLIAFKTRDSGKLVAKPRQMLAVGDEQSEKPTEAKNIHKPRQWRLKAQDNVTAVAVQN